MGKPIIMNLYLLYFYNNNNKYFIILQKYWAKQKTMSAYHLQRELPVCNIQLINKFLYKRKSSRQIVQWMKNAHALSPYLWKCLIRDSKLIVVQLDQHQFSGFNLCSFIENFIQRSSMDECPKFLIQILQNNPSLIFNRYYVGNGGSPAHEMIASFLVSGRINSSFQYAHECIYDPLFRILQSSLKNLKPLDTYHVGYLLRSLYFYPNITKKRIQTIFLVLKTSQNHLLSTDFRQEGNYAINKMFSTLFQQYFTLFKGYRDYFTYYFNQHYEDYEKYLNAKTEIQMSLWAIIKDMDMKFPEIINCYSNIIVKELIKVSNQLEFMKKLVYETKHFRQILFDEQFIFKIFVIRNFRLCQFLWSFEQKRKLISQMRKNGKSILQMIGMSYGLTHNLIAMLWQSGLFEKPPLIQNKKSEKILKAKFGWQ